MKKIVGFWVVGVLGTLVVSGCAMNDVAKKDEAIAPSATTQANQTDVKTVKNDFAAPTPLVVQTPLTAKKEMSKSDAQINEQFKSALDKIYFDFDSYALSEQARKTLTKNTDYLRKNTVAKLRIEGNCDERGSAEYNIALGEKRAKAALKYLVTMGIPAERLTTISYGKEKPADPGHDESAWSKNRRDDFATLSK